MGALLSPAPIPGFFFGDRDPERCGATSDGLTRVDGEDTHSSPGPDVVSGSDDDDDDKDEDEDDGSSDGSAGPDFSEESCSRGVSGP